MTRARRADGPRRRGDGRDPVVRARRALRAHLAATAGVLLAVLGAMLWAEWTLTRQQADDAAQATANRLAESVLQPLGALDLGAGEIDAEAIDARLRGFFDSGAVVRIKVWRVEGAQVRVVYSDRREVVGDVRAFSPELAGRLDAGESVVLPVPDDGEHRHEVGLPVELREVFLGFTDAAGHRMRLEVYVPVHSRQVIANAVPPQIAVVGLGLALLAGILLPLSVRLARRLQQLGRERERALAYGMRAREQERLDLARRLHDDVIQSLSGARLALGAIARRPGGDPVATERVVAVLGQSTAALRGMLDEFVPTAVTAATIDHALAELVAGVRGAAGAVRIEYDGPGPADAARLPGLLDDAAAQALFRAAQEGLRNALRHASAARIRVGLAVPAGSAPASGHVELTIDDDGVGHTGDDRDAARSRGHVGLQLMARSITALGGTVDIRSERGAGSTIALSIPARSPGSE